jgi:hypothetical protein
MPETGSGEKFNSNQEEAARLLNRLKSMSQGIDRPASLFRAFEQDLENILEQPHKPGVEERLSEIEAEIKKYEDD